MSNETMPPEPDLELVHALQELRTKREPWYLDRWLIASVAAIGGAAFMYVARQPEVDHYKNAPQNFLRNPNRLGLKPTSPNPAPEEPKTAPVVDPKAAATTDAKATATAPADGKTPAVTTDAQAEKDPPDGKDKPAPKGDGGSRADRTPMNPLGGDIESFGTLPGISGTPSALPAAAPSIEPIQGLTVAGTGGAGVGATLAGIARKFGGGLKKYQEYTGRDKSASGYIVWVPEKNSRAFLDKLKSAGGIDISDQEEGSSESRSRILTEALRTNLAKLTKTRADLLLKYYEDAPAVKEVDGQIAEVNKSINSLKSPGAGYAVAKIETG